MVRDDDDWPPLRGLDQMPNLGDNRNKSGDFHLRGPEGMEVWRHGGVEVWIFHCIWIVILSCAL